MKIWKIIPHRHSNDFLQWKEQRIRRISYLFRSCTTVRAFAASQAYGSDGFWISKLPKNVLYFKNEKTLNIWHFLK